MISCQTNTYNKIYLGLENYLINYKNLFHGYLMLKKIFQVNIYYSTQSCENDTFVTGSVMVENFLCKHTWRDCINLTCIYERWGWYEWDSQGWSGKRLPEKFRWNKSFMNNFLRHCSFTFATTIWPSEWESNSVVMGNSWGKPMTAAAFSWLIISNDQRRSTVNTIIR